MKRYRAVEEAVKAAENKMGTFREVLAMRREREMAAPMTTSPIAAVRALPRFAYLSPAEAREVVLAVLGAVREPSEGMASAGGSVEIEPYEGVYTQEIGPYAASAAFRAAIDALVAEVQEEG